MEVQLLFLKNPKHCSLCPRRRQDILQKEPGFAMAASSPEFSCLPPPSPSLLLGWELLTL